MRNTDKWLRRLIPVQFILILAQPTTGLLGRAWPDKVLLYAHILPGMILVSLVILHLGLNRDWLQKTYFKRKEM